MYLLKRKSKLSFACLGSNIIPIIVLEFFCKEVFNFKFLFDNHDRVCLQNFVFLKKRSLIEIHCIFELVCCFTYQFIPSNGIQTTVCLLFSCFPNPSLDDSVVGDRKSEGLSWKGLHARLWTLEYLSR